MLGGAFLCCPPNENVEQNLQEKMAMPAPAVTVEMGDQLRQLREKLLYSMSIMSLATLLDPRFKVIGFFRQTKATEAIKDQSFNYTT